MPAPDGSAPVITMTATTTPKAVPHKAPTPGPNSAPATIIGTKVSVIGKPPKLMKVATV